MTAYVIVPGWGGSDADHWQSVWTRELNATRVHLPYWLDGRLHTWLNALDETIANAPEPPVVIAHSLGCIVLAHWARTTRRSVRAALLVAPADVEAPWSTEVSAFSPVPRAPLPFTSRIIASDDDPYASLERTEAFANSWGSDLVVVPRGGHLNSESGLRRWWFGRAQLARLLQRTDLALSA